MTDDTPEPHPSRESVSDELLLLWIALERRSVGAWEAARELERMAQQLRGRG